MFLKRNSPLKKKYSLNIYCHRVCLHARYVSKHEKAYYYLNVKWNQSRFSLVKIKSSNLVYLFLFFSPLNQQVAWIGQIYQLIWYWAVPGTMVFTSKKKENHIRCHMAWEHYSEFFYPVIPLFGKVFGFWLTDTGWNV